MYLLGNEATIEWTILATANPPALGDLDLLFKSPQKGKNYKDSPALSEDYTPPTASTNGKLVQKFTPNCEGLWKIQLVIGDSNNYEVLSKVEMYVFDNNTVTHLRSKKIPLNVIFTDVTELTVEACADNGIMYVFTSNAPINVTLMGSGSGKGYGEVVYFMQGGNGEVIVTGDSGTLVSSSDGDSTRTINSVIAGIYLRIAEWVLVGDTSYYVS